MSFHSKCNFLKIIQINSNGIKSINTFTMCFYFCIHVCSWFITFARYFMQNWSGLCPFEFILFCSLVNSSSSYSVFSPDLYFSDSSIFFWHFIDSQSAFNWTIARFLFTCFSLMFTQTSMISFTTLFLFCFHCYFHADNHKAHSSFSISV